MADAAYESAVRTTFGLKPLRTVLMIDDEFPTYSDLAVGKNEENAKRFNEKDRAVALYQAFSDKRHMICDVENVASEVKPERFRKSDLILLDYHLGPGENNSERSIEILRDLAASKHFNTVVVYTNEPNLNKVWLDVITSLSGGWSALPTELEGDAAHHWERLSDENKLPTAQIEAVMGYAKRRSMRDIPGDVQAAARKELVDLDVPQNVCSAIIEAMIHKFIAGMSGKYAGEPKRQALGDWREDRRWIQSGNAFVTIVKKDALTNDGNDPAKIMKSLEDALIAWRPNLIQIIVSEIQNILELDALATADDHLRDPVTHAALTYYLLDALGVIDPSQDVDVKAPLMALIDKIVDGMRRKLSSDPELLALSRDALLGELRDTGWTTETWPKPRKLALLDAAMDVARAKGAADRDATAFRLNTFFNTERFSRAHLTTGTVFYHAETQLYFVAASPACDLVARQPSKFQVWSHSVFPITPMVAILLEEKQGSTPLQEAENGLHIFLENEHGRKALKIVQGPGDQPPYEVFMVKDAGRVREREGKTLFDASRLMPRAEVEGDAVKISASERDWVDGTFEVVDQLKGMNAAHVLQIAGQHLSRIGLDFISLPRD
ncbi:MULTISPECIES: response regulator receiver domain [unclassified Bradyrhizobium]|uniref:response regulator receiver domain n=1 Tax=unclassified Bradyrhizobium TaxID=2631580 RepID=UPI00291611C6|nr:MULTISPECIES: response regulator receiver domain [unclassified Bradyrhizobium]